MTRAIQLCMSLSLSLFLSFSLSLLKVTNFACCWAIVLYAPEERLILGMFWIFKDWINPWWSKKYSLSHTHTPLGWLSYCPFWSFNCYNFACYWWLLFHLTGTIYTFWSIWKFMHWYKNVKSKSDSCAEFSFNCIHS